MNAGTLTISRSDDSAKYLTNIMLLILGIAAIGSRGNNSFHVNKVFPSIPPCNLLDQMKYLTLGAQ